MRGGVGPGYHYLFVVAASLSLSLSLCLWLSHTHCQHTHSCTHKTRTRKTLISWSCRKFCFCGAALPAYCVPPPATVSCTHMHTHVMCVITRRLQALSLSLSLSLSRSLSFWPQDHQTSAPVGRHHTTNPPLLTHSYGLFCLNVLTVEFKNIINRLLNVIGLKGGGGQWSEGGGRAGKTCSTYTKLTSPTHPHTHTHFRRLTLPGFTHHPRLPASVSAAIGRRCFFCVCLGGVHAEAARVTRRSVVVWPPSKAAARTETNSPPLFAHIKQNRGWTWEFVRFWALRLFFWGGCGRGAARWRRRCWPRTLLTQTATPLSLCSPPCCTDGPVLGRRLPLPAQRPMGAAVIILCALFFVALLFVSFSRVPF